MRTLFTFLAVFVLAGCFAQTNPSGANPADRPSLKDFDDAPPAGPLFMPFR